MKTLAVTNRGEHSATDRPLKREPRMSRNPTPSDRLPGLARRQRASAETAGRQPANLARHQISPATHRRVARTRRTDFHGRPAGRVFTAVPSGNAFLNIMDRGKRDRIGLRSKAPCTRCRRGTAPLAIRRPEPNRVARDRARDRRGPAWTASMVLSRSATARYTRADVQTARHRLTTCRRCRCGVRLRRQRGSCAPARNAGMCIRQGKARAAAAATDRRLRSRSACAAPGAHCQHLKQESIREP